jgi:tyrosyl-tRNA synthetase
LYIGADATGSALHLGHATNYIILEKFRRLGHKVIILIGDFTARIGDPTDKSAARVQLTREQVIDNAKTWLKQLSPIIDINNKENPVEIVYNHDWLSKMTFEDVIGLASNFTVQRMMERDMFEKRWAEEKPIYLHEFFYPLMQGYDSVHLDVDVELCGNDQKFNALAGRTLLQKYKNKEKFVFITTLLVNPVTGEKMMSKSLGTGVFLDISAQDMFGKIMSQADENIPQLFTDCTIVSLKEIEEIKNKLSLKETNPRDIKLELAFEVTKIYHGEERAIEAKESFLKTFSEGGIPAEIPEIFVPAGTPLGMTLIAEKIVESNTEFKRLVNDGAVKNINGEEIKDFNFVLSVPGIFKIGKRRFIDIKII